MRIKKILINLLAAFLLCNCGGGKSPASAPAFSIPLPTIQNAQSSNHNPEPIVGGLNSATAAFCSTSVSTSYASTAIIRVPWSATFSAPGFNLAQTTPTLYVAYSASLTNPGILSADDFPAKFANIQVPVNAQSTFTYPFPITGTFTLFFAWNIPQGATSLSLCSPYLTLNIQNTGGGNPSGSTSDVQVVLKEIDGVSSGNAPVNFSHVFKDGDYFPGQIAAKIVETGAEIPLQVDVLRSNPDGSIRHAMLSVIVPALTQYAAVTLQLLHRPPAVTPAAFSWPVIVNSLDPRLVLTGSSGAGTPGGSPNMYGSLRDIVQDPKTCTPKVNGNGDSASWRFNGPIMKECVIWAKMRQCSGSCSNASTIIDGELDYSIRLTYLTGREGVRVDFVLENTHFKLNANDTTSTFKDHHFSFAKLASGTSTLWQGSKNLYTLWQGTRWRLGPLYYGQAFIRPEIHWNPNDLHQARAFDLVAGNTPYNYIDTFPVTVWSEPNELNTLPNNMGQVAGQWYIGPLHTYLATLLSTWNRKSLDVTATVDSNPISSNYEVHYRQSADAGLQTQKPGGPIGVACTLNNGVLSSPWKALNPAITNSPPSQDIAHQPRLGLSYLFTGDLFAEEELEYWNMWNTAWTTWPTHCIVTGPERAIAWSMRNLIDFASFIPNQSPRFALAQTLVDEWAKYWAKSTYQDVSKTIHIPNEAGSKGLTVSGRLNWTSATQSSMWQQDWMCWAAQLAAKRGFQAYDPIRDWLCQVVIDLYTAEDDPAQRFVVNEYNASGQLVTNTYSFPASMADAYSTAKEIFYQMRANQVKDQNGNLIPCDSAVVPPVDLYEPKRQPINWGELWYVTYVNTVHAGWPVAQWCTNFNYSFTVPLSGQNPLNMNNFLHDGRNWSAYNGWQSNPPFNKLGHEYSHQPGTTAVMEAVYDQTPTGTSTLDKTKANAMFQKYLQYAGTPSLIDVIPGILK